MEPLDEPRPDEGGAPAASEGGELGDALGIGARVSGVFTAAERAAQHMLDMARAEAEDARRRAAAETEALRAQRRSQAEEEARRIVAEAEVEAHRIRERARAAALEIENETRAREERLIEEIRVLEERVDWARDGLRDVASRVSEVAPAVERISAARAREEG